MKENTPEQQLKFTLQTDNPRTCWRNYINENSCNDPFWPDGCNMNLTRNHIISYKNIAELCEKSWNVTSGRIFFENSTGS